LALRSNTIVLSSYCNDQKIQCDYVYGLTQAVADNVCRTPQITLIDNDRISVTQDGTTSNLSSFGELLSESKCSYQQLIENEDVITYFIDKSAKKLSQIRKKYPDAGGLIVAASVEHANLIAEILFEQLGEHARVATYREDDPQSIINAFKLSADKWIISIGMISEGTNIPRLRVCCHLTRVKTELHFRQVLGRILRSNNEVNDDGFIYVPAEPNLIEYANRVAQEIPDGITIKLLTMNNNDKDTSLSIDTNRIPLQTQETILRIDRAASYESGKVDFPSQNNYSSLAKSYESSLNVFGKFKQEIMSLPDLHLRRCD
jgi:superfamily II DNA or RNA helicase